MSTLPRISNRQDYVEIYPDTAPWLPAVTAICKRHGLDPDDLRRETPGTHVVFRSGACIIKLFSTLWPDDFISERSVLGHIEGLPAPDPVAEGEIEGWPYLVMTAVPGIPAGQVWPDLDFSAREEVLVQLGKLMCRLHAHPPVAGLATDWHAFLRERIDGAMAHHHAGEPWRRWIRERIDGFEEAPFDPVLLGADITEDHILLSKEGGRWEITGLIDFGDAMMGHPHYEFIAPLGCYTFGQPHLSRVLLRAYGLELTPELAERLTTYCLLHRFARLEDFLRRCPVSDGEAFFRALWGVERIGDHRR